MSFTQTWFRFQYEFLYLESTQTGKYLLTSVSVWKVPIVVHFFDEMKHFFYIYHFLSIKEQSWDLQTNHHNCNMKVKVLTSSFIFLSTSNPKIPQKCRIGDNCYDHCVPVGLKSKKYPLQYQRSLYSRFCASSKNVYSLILKDI